MSLCLWHVWISVTALSSQSPTFAQLIILSSSNHFFPYISRNLPSFLLPDGHFSDSSAGWDSPEFRLSALLFDVYNHSLSHLSSLHGLFFSFTWLSLWPFHPSSCSGQKSFFFLVLIDLVHLLNLALSKSCQLFLNVYLVSDHSNYYHPILSPVGWLQQLSYRYLLPPF